MKHYKITVKGPQKSKQPIVIDDDQEVEPKIEKQVKQDKPQDDDLNNKVNQDITPWFSKRTSQLRHPTLRLHNEIIEFYQYIIPSEEEHNLRVSAYERVQKFLQECVPGCHLEPFGSFRTKLYLPNADIDMVLIEEAQSTRTLYKRVSNAIMAAGDKFTNVQIIANAKVPIIKFIDTQSLLHFDISFNKDDGLKQLNEIKKAFEVYPEMPYLLMLLKCFLRQRDFHETYSGGIGSFLLFQMILAFLREFRRDLYSQNKQETLCNITLGEYLLKFLEFYGSKFDVSRKRIIMVGGGNIVNKPQSDDRFSLISPQDQEHDVGHSSYKIKEIFKIFLNRFNFMTNYNFPPNESVLKYFINPSSQRFMFLKQQ